MAKHLDLIADIQGFNPEKVREIARQAGFTKMSTILQIVQDFDSAPFVQVLKVNQSNAFQAYRLVSALALFTYAFANYESFTIWDEELAEIQTFSRKQDEVYYLDMLLNYTVQLYMLALDFPDQIS